MTHGSGETTRRTASAWGKHAARGGAGVRAFWRKSGIFGFAVVMAFAGAGEAQAHVRSHSRVHAAARIQTRVEPLQCVPYARELSGIDIHGNARTWWAQAKGRYARGSTPRVGAVVAMAASEAMPLGHVAVVAKVVDERHILIDQANWSAPGEIEHAVPVEDVSEAGDWSMVRVWYGPAEAMGSRSNPVEGFIYPEAPMASSATLAEKDVPRAGASQSDAG